MLVKRFCGPWLLMVVACLAIAGEGFGEPSAHIPPELRGLDKLKGEWECEVTFPDRKYKARFVNSWAIDGFVFKQEWFEADAKGLELRAFNPKDGKWTGYNIYTGTPWASTSVSFEEGKVIINHAPSESEKGMRLSKEIYWEITADSFRLSSMQSFDDGKTWENGPFEIKATRLK